MTILLPTLAVAFAAFCVWLTLRAFNRRERWAKRLVIGLILGSPLLYLMSLGPACWISSRTDCGDGLVTKMYGPLFPLFGDSIYEEPPPRLFRAIVWYSILWAPNGSSWVLSPDPAGGPFRARWDIEYAE